MNTRAIAAKALSSIVADKRSIKAALQKLDLEPLATRDRAFVQELVYGVCRWFFTLETELHQILNKPLRKRDADIKCLLLVGLYQLRYLDTAHHALVKETVDATVSLKKNWARKLVNASLRTAIRTGWPHTQSDNPPSTLDSLRMNNPAWLVAAIESDWPGDLESILSASNERPPLSLRVNTLQFTRADYLQTLSTNDIDATQTSYSPYGLRLAPTVTSDIPAFYDGAVSVQDEAAQLAVSLLAPTAGERILDACAAPGGKAGHIREVTSDGDNLFAIDVEEARVSLIKDNFTRLKLDANILVADATQPEAWWDGKQFDKILIDAPCSASGIIRRQPDVRLHREAKDILRLSSLQFEILKALWPLLRLGGTAVYATCSILRDENDGVIRKFVSNTNDCEVQDLSVDWGTPTEFGHQILPGEQDMDGFFYSVLVKK